MEQPKFEKRDKVYHIIDSLLSVEEIKNAMEKGNFLWQNVFHEYDVYDHSADYLKHIKKFSDDPNIIAASYLHDIGKPMVAKPKLDKKTGQVLEKEPGIPYHSFDDHEKVGADFIRNLDPKTFTELNKKFNLDLDQERISQLINCHYLPMKGIKGLRKLIKEEKTFAEWKQAFEKLEQSLDKPAEAPNVPRSEILLMFLADKLAQGPNLQDKNELMAIRDIMSKENLTSKDKKKELEKIYQIQQDNLKNKIWD